MVGLLDESAPFHLDLVPSTICMGYLVAKYVKEYQDSFSSNSSNMVSNARHKLAVFLMEKISNFQRTSSLSYREFIDAIQDISSTWNLEFQHVIRRISERSIDELAECLETLCVPTDTKHIQPWSPMGRFARMLRLAIQTAFFDRLSTLKGELREYIKPQSTQAKANQFDIIDRIERGELVQDADEILKELLSKHRASPRLHFARFLNFQLQRNYLQALEALHIYHNFAINTQEGEDFGPQYASLHLACFYWNFNYKEEAMTAIEETIRVAQSVRDMVCVAHALSILLMWEPYDSKRAKQCYEVALQHNIPLVQALSTLTSVPHEPFHNTEKSRPLQQWLTLKNAVYQIRDCRRDKNEPKDHILKEWNYLQLKTNLTAAGVWYQSGNRVLSKLQLSLCQPQTTEDILSMVSLHVRLSLAPTQVTLGKMFVNVLKSIASIARQFPQLTSELKFHQCMNMVLFEWSLKTCEVKRAWHYAREWEALAHKNALPIDLFEVQLAKARMAHRLGNRQEARAILSELRTKTLPPYFKARTLLQYAQVIQHDDAPFTALTPLMECLALCDEISCAETAAQAELLLGNLYMSMDRYKDAISLLENRMPQVLENCSVHIQSQYYLALAKAYLHHMAPLDKIVSLLEQSRHGAMYCEDLKLSVEIGAVQSRVYQLYQDFQACERIALNTLGIVSLIEANENKAIDGMHLVATSESIEALLSLRGHS